MTSSATGTGGSGFARARAAVQNAGRWQGKGSVALTPITLALPLTFHANYGRGINSVDARGVVQYPDQPRLATTDFYQAGASSLWAGLPSAPICS